MKWVVLLLFVLAAGPVGAQHSLLEAKVSLHCREESLEKVLVQLQERYAIAFSYSDDVIPVHSRISLAIDDEPLRQLLDTLEARFSISYKLLNTRIILTRKPVPLTQSIRGRVLDQHTQAPIAGAVVLLAGTDPPMGSISNVRGEFLIAAVPVGRANLYISCLGYQSRAMQQLLVGTGKELVLQIGLAEAVDQLEEVVVTADKIPASGAGLPVVSARSFSVEESKRYAGSVGDPARMASGFAGVTGASDESNALIIRGNSPRGVLWRIEGIEVPNPNHFASEGASSGVVSVLSANVLDDSEFLTGAFPAQYGNALSGVFDLRLRKGNNQRREYSFQAGFLGLEASAEGPFSANQQASYLVNYRYSTLSVLDKLGFSLNRAGEFKDYQDLAFNISYPTRRFGAFSLFGIGGLSRANLADTSRLDNAYANMGVLGLTHQQHLGSHTFLKSTLSLSGTQITKHDEVLNWSDRLLRLDEEYTKSYARASVQLNHRLSNRHLLEGGGTYSRLYYNFYLRNQDSDNGDYAEIINFRERETAGTGISQAFLQSTSTIAPLLQATYGFHLLHFGLSNDISLEPRLGIQWQATVDKRWSLGVGKHSKIENLQYYLSRHHQQGGSEVQLNKNIGFSRAMHYVLGYEQLVGADTRLKLEGYYQRLYGVPVQQDPNAIYSTLNEDSGFITDTLISKGSGENYGLELSLEKALSKHFYYLLNGSLFQATFRAADGKERNTAYNGNYNLHMLGGYEHTLKSSGGSKLVGINVKLTCAGGRRYVPIDLEESRRLGHQVYDLNRAFEPKLPAYLRADLQLSYRRNNPRYATEWRLDVQNMTNHRNPAYYYYDAGKESVQLKYQLGLLPVLSYRVDF